MHAATCMHKLKDKEIYYLFSSASYYLISWPEEGTFSIVASNKIISPPPDVLKPGTICKVKGLEKYLAQVLAGGNKTDMESKLADEEGQPEPPAKRAKVDKENMTPRQPKGAKAKTKRKSQTRTRAKSKGKYAHTCTIHVHVYVHVNVPVVCVMLELLSSNCIRILLHVT